MKNSERYIMLKDKNTLKKEFREGQLAYVSVKNFLKPTKVKRLQVIIKEIRKNYIETDVGYFGYRKGKFVLILPTLSIEYGDYCYLFPTEQACRDGIRDSMEFDNIVCKIRELTSREYYKHYSLEQLREVAKILNL